MPNTRGPWVARRLPALVIALAVLVAVVGVEVWGTVRYRASADPARSLAARLTNAEAAYRVMPLWRAYRVRAITLRGLVRFERGDVLGAYDVLHAEFVAETIAGKVDPELRAAHSLVYDEYLVLSSRTAHQLHGREQWDGTVAPEDLQPFPRPATTTPLP